MLYTTLLECQNVQMNWVAIFILYVLEKTFNSKHFSVTVVSMIEWFWLVYLFNETLKFFVNYNNILEVFIIQLSEIRIQFIQIFRQKKNLIHKKISICWCDVGVEAFTVWKIRQMIYIFGVFLSYYCIPIEINSNS